LGQRAALYCRVSTADQSCARQERDLTAFAARAGCEVVGVFKETGSGATLDRAERKKVMALAQRREIDAVPVTELSRWVRSTLDLLDTLKDLEMARIGRRHERPGFRPVDTARPDDGDNPRRHCRVRTRVDPGTHPFGHCCCEGTWQRLGRQPGQRPKSDRLAPKVLALIASGRSYRLIGRELGLSKNRVAAIVKRTRAAKPEVLDMSARRVSSTPSMA
jgi:DNA invertase Pin-like site-specific DNA recombinase